MPLSPAAPREHIHTRLVECRGYRREDGLWDIEGHITDVKTYSFRNRWRGEIASGEPVHEMWLRLTIDDDLLIHAAEAATDAGPYQVCPEITPNFAVLAGERIKPGFNRRVKELLGGVKGCTHLVELLGPIATTAFQTTVAARSRKGAQEPRRRRPGIINTCHALAEDGAVVKRLWPEFHTGS